MTLGFLCLRGSLVEDLRYRYAYLFPGRKIVMPMSIFKAISAIGRFNYFLSDLFVYLARFKNYYNTIQ